MEDCTRPTRGPARRFALGADRDPLSAAAPKVSSDSYESSSTSTSTNSSSAISWVNWFCSLPGHEFFLEVPEDFIEDDFNLCGLNTLVPHYNECLDMILDIEDSPSSSASGSSRSDRPPSAAVEQGAEKLYGLIHARYVLTKPGLQLVSERFQAGEYGQCPRALCGGQAVVPCGRSDSPGVDTVKLFCPRCGDLYHPRESRYRHLDGAYFPTTLPGLLFLSYPELIPTGSIIFPSQHEEGSEGSGITVGGSEAADRPAPAPAPPAPEPKRRLSGSDSEGEEPPPPAPAPVRYVPRIFGFRISKKSAVGPRMAWLRAVPGTDADD
ncbi:casein kinase II, regulatory subunit [Hyaloraphidium curvatum]|nr:casein kinase II, regulatory subunit [Hyaloraphidium curvatum]